MNKRLHLIRKTVIRTGVCYFFNNLPSRWQSSIHSDLLLLNFRSAKLEGVAGLANNSGLDLGGTKKSVLVRYRGERAPRGLVGGAVEDDVPGDRVANLLRVNREHSAVNVLEHTALDKSLGTHASVHSGDATVVDRVDDVSGTEAEQGHAAVDVLEVVVGVSDAELALVLGAVAVAVADKGCLEVVVEVGVADGQVVSAVAEVGQAVVVVLARGQVGGQVKVVKPHIGRLLDANGVAAGVAGLDLADGQVADDHVLGLADKETEAGDSGGGVDAENRLVAADADFGGAGDLALDIDGDCRFILGVDSSDELVVGANSDDLAAGAAGLLMNVSHVQFSEEIRWRKFCA